MESAISRREAWIEVDAEDRAEIADALHRFCAGQDRRDRELFESAFSAQATLDFIGPALRLGARIEVFKGPAAIADTIFSVIAALDSTRTGTNLRVTKNDGVRASAFALVEAQHVTSGGHARRQSIKHIYLLELSRTGRVWSIDRMKINLVWFSSEPAAMLPGAGG